MYDINNSPEDLGVELATQIFAVYPWLFGGLILKITEAVDRQKWLAYFKGLVGEGVEIKCVPTSCTDENLYGGLNFLEYVRTGKIGYSPGIFVNEKGFQVLNLNIVGNLSDSQIKIFGETLHITTMN